jgi:class 3 adenylate cyclase
MNVEIVDLLDMKAGMHIGPLVVGIVGNTRFYFDVYGGGRNRRAVSQYSLSNLF